MTISLEQKEALRQYATLLGSDERIETDLDPEIVRQDAKEMEDLAEATFVPEAVRGKISSFTVDIPLREYILHPRSGGKMEERIWSIKIDYKDGQRTGLDMFTYNHSSFYRMSAEAQPPSINWWGDIENKWWELETHYRTNDPFWNEQAKRKLNELVEAATHPQPPTDLIA